jgi:8-amino-7-oxononanoate synthase
MASCPRRTCAGRSATADRWGGHRLLLTAEGNRVADVFAKCREYSADRDATGAGIYPYYHPISGWLGPAEALVHGRRVIMAGSNDYLGLARDPRVVAAATEAVHRYGATCSGSRLLNGTLQVHERLEQRLARFLRREAAVVVTTGFQANLALAALLGRADTVFADRENHASLADAVRLGHATHRRYPHRDFDHLDRMLAAAGPGGRMIVTDGVFSAGGDLCDLPGLVKLARAHQARLVLDGGHDIGLLGRHGRGTPEHFGLEDEVDLVTVTLSKSFGSLGGVLAGPAEVIRYLRHHARSLIFAASVPPANAAAALAALDILEAEPDRRRRVFDLAEVLHNGLRALGFHTGASQTPIVPVHIGDSARCMRFWTELLAAGVFGNAMIPPAVAEGGALIRLSVTADHTGEHVGRIVDAFAAVGRRLGVVPARPPAQYPPVTMARS